MPTKTNVLIVGGSFSGLSALRQLKDKTDVTIIEPKNYFEYTPGILHLLTGSKAQAALLSTFSEVSHGSTHTRAYFEGVKPEEKVAIVRSVDGKVVSEIPYDYLIICTGVPYISPIRGSRASIDFQDRVLEIDMHEKKFHQSNKVVVVGGGLVGVELAAELVSRRKSSGGLPKEVLLLSRSTLLGAMPKKAGDIAKSWLSKHGVELLLGEEIANICPSSATSVAAAKANRQTINTKSGRMIEDIDVIVDCTNKRSDQDMAIHSKGVPKENVVWPYNDKGFVEVNESLQSTWDPSIFAAGDVIELCSGVGLAATTQASGTYGTKSRLSAVRNAHLAESQAELVAENILRLRQGQRSTSYVQLKTYPQTPFYGSNVTPLLACVSLGPHNGIVIFNDLVIGGALIGMIGALVKFIIERSKVAEIRQKTWGRAFWAFGHVVVNTCHRTACIVRNIFLRSPKALHLLAKVAFIAILTLTGFRFMLTLAFFKKNFLA